MPALRCRFKHFRPLSASSGAEHCGALGCCICAIIKELDLQREQQFLRLQQEILKKERDEFEKEKDAFRKEIDAFNADRATQMPQR